MKAIVAVNNLGFIGKDNRLLWHNKEDLQHFKRMTDGCTLLVGYNTYQTLPPLPNRTIFVDTKQKNYTNKKIKDNHYYIHYHSVIEYINNIKIDWCIGGKRVYEKYQSMFTELHISHISNNGIGDVQFPNLQYLNPSCKIFNYQF